ncbi:M56 family metallopeptidase [Chryseobacterium phocaeense]|uniref:M56 family metallopeptidase n=1 Tax=Chryseobacterium phocaeense TaxID=1816690 RepID=UPI0009BA2B9E|nr:M56 family metallopeptidase [Chryseobacterium phocaeense]
METLLLYFGKVIIGSGVMFLYYRLSLKDKTFHHYNRFYLLSAMIISLLLPLIRVEDFTIEVNNDMYMLLDKIQNFNTDKNIDNGHIYFRIIFSALGLVSLYFVGKLMFGIFKIQRLKKQFQKESFDGINFYRTDLTEAPFSYFKNLFWKNTITLDSEVGEQILKHEMVHIEQKHSFDKICIEIITSVFWFNPFFHIIKKEISLIHEYLADKKAVKQSDTKAFAQMLLASHFSGTQLPAASPFLSSNLKKRLKMLQKPKTKFGYARRIFALPVLFSVAFAYMVNAKNKEIKETNIAIEEAVSQIKKDTIPQTTGKLEIVSPKPFKESASKKELTELGKKIEEKSKALKNLKPESKEFQKNLDEIGELSGKIGKITSSDDFKMAHSLSPEDSKRIKEFFKSDDWKNNIKELENLDIKIPDLSDLNFDFPDAPPAYPKAPDAPRVKVLRFNDAFYHNWSSADTKESRRAIKAAKAAQKKADKARDEAIRLGEKARVMGEEARMQGQAARITGEKARLDGEKARREIEKVRLEVARKVTDGAKGNVYFFKTTDSDKPMMNRTMEMSADFMKKDSNGNIALNGVRKFKVTGGLDDTKVFLDGKEITREEMNAIKPETIARVMINKANGAGGSKGEIRIETKK